MFRFKDTIKLVGINPCVRVPARITKALGNRGYIPVIVHLERGAVPSTLVPIGDGGHRLYINKAMLRCTDARVGNRIELGLELDSQSRVLAMPDDLLIALSKSSIAQRRWDALVPSKRKEIIRYLSFAKTPTTRQRNLATLTTILTSASGRGVLCGIRINSQ